MKIFIVLAHQEHKSFNAAMFGTAIDTLTISTPSCVASRHPAIHRF
jgi:putative NADPH-quinone reductase